jgi:hypothetical protein
MFTVSNIRLFMKFYLIYQAYGKIEILHELLYAVYSLLKLYDKKLPFELVIYTDQIDFLKNKLPPKVIYKSLHPELIKEWKGENDFVHRVKIKMLQDFTASSTEECGILYLDTDVMFLQKIDDLLEKIAAGNYIMHASEGKIMDKPNLIFKKLNRFLLGKGKGKTAITPQTQMYNAGVLGFKSSDKAMLEKVLQTSDILYSLYQKHIMEQLAFSFFMLQYSSNGVYSATTEIYHYWNFKEFRPILKHFLEHYSTKSYDFLIDKIHFIHPHILSAPKMEYENLNFFAKAIRKLQKNRWKMPAYSLD